MFPRQLEANGRQWSHSGEDSRTRWLTNTGSQRNSAHVQIYIVTASIPSLWSLLLQPTQRHYDLYCYSNYYANLISRHSIITSLYFLLFQHLLRHNDFHCYSIHHVTMNPLIQQLPRHYALCCYHIYHGTMIPIVTALITSLWPLPLQHLLRRYDLHCYSTY